MFYFSLKYSLISMESTKKSSTYRSTQTTSEVWNMKVNNKPPLFLKQEIELKKEDLVQDSPQTCASSTPVLLPPWWGAHQQNWTPSMN